MESNRKVMIVMVIIMAFVLIAGFGALVGANTQNSILLQFTEVLANIVMAGIIAVQAITTAEAAEQTKKQAELMNKSLIEMKKERMNIEYMKNEVIGYIKKLEDMLNDALHNEVPIYYELPQYSNLTPETPRRLQDGRRVTKNEVWKRGSKEKSKGC